MGARPAVRLNYPSHARREDLPFGERTKVFPDPRLAKAVVDRLTHRAHIIDTGTESWRFRHGLTRRSSKAKTPGP